MRNQIDEMAFLANSANRIDILRQLGNEPHTRGELVEVTDASRPTVGRVLGEFEQRNWVVRTGRNYELTPVGQLVLDGLADFLSLMETEQALRRAVQWLPTEQIGFDLEMFRDATVSIPEPGRSHQPINRFIELVEAAESAHGFGIATLAPKSAETLFRKSCSGMTTEIIYPCTVLEDILRSTPALARDAIDRGTLTTFVHGDLPCGLYVFDDRIILGGYNRETGVLRVVIDTDDPDALEWADRVYTTYRREAEPFDLTRIWDGDGKIQSARSDDP